MPAMKTRKKVRKELKPATIGKGLDPASRPSEEELARWLDQLRTDLLLVHWHLPAFLNGNLELNTATMFEPEGCPCPTRRNSSNGTMYCCGDDSNPYYIAEAQLRLLTCWIEGKPVSNENNLKIFALRTAFHFPPGDERRDTYNEIASHPGVWPLFGTETMDCNDLANAAAAQLKLAVTDDTRLTCECAEGS